MGARILAVVKFKSTYFFYKKISIINKWHCFLWHLEPAKTFFSLFSPYFSLYLTSLKTIKTSFIKSAVLWLFNSKFKPNKYFSPQKLISLINFGFKFYDSSFLVDSNRYPVTVQSFNRSYNFIQSFKYSVFHPTILKSQGHGAIFTCDCNNLLKGVFVLLSYEKITPCSEALFWLFIKKTNNYVTKMLISVILTPFEHWSCWGIHEVVGVFYWVKIFLHSSSW